MEGDRKDTLGYEQLMNADEITKQKEIKYYLLNYFSVNEGEANDLMTLVAPTRERKAADDAAKTIATDSAADPKR